jgi:aspartate racemase
VRTIGLIGGVTWLSTIEYYREINRLVAARLGGHHSARMVIHSLDFAEHLAIQERGWPAVADELSAAARGLVCAGADFLVIAANTLHRVADEVESAAGRPLLHIADATAGAILAQGRRTVGLLGTRFTMGEDFYRRRLSDRHGIRVLVPPADDCRTVDRIIYDELAQGRIEDAARNACVGVIDRLSAVGAEGVILGCTELPLLLRPGDAKVILFDTVAIHAAAAVDRALAAGGG